MEPKENVRLVEFECVEEPLPKGTAAVPRPAARPRQTIPSVPDRQSLFQCLDCDAVDLPPKTKAEPRPQGRERRDLGDMQSTTDLAAIVEERGPLPPSEVVRLIHQLCQALVQVDGGSTVTHHDLKPSNIIFRAGHSKGKLLLADFGISRLLAKGHHDNSGAAPNEKNSDESPPDEEDDYVFRLGSIAYYSLSRTYYSEQALPLQRLRPDVPGELRQIVERCLSREPGERFASVSELLSALETCADV